MPGKYVCESMESYKNIYNFLSIILFFAAFYVLNLLWQAILC